MGGGLALLEQETANFEPPWGRTREDGGICVVSACAALGAEDDLLVLYAGSRAAEKRQFHPKPGSIDLVDDGMDDGFGGVEPADPAQPASGLLLSRHPMGVALRHATSLREPRPITTSVRRYAAAGIAAGRLSRSRQDNSRKHGRARSTEWRRHAMAELARLLLHRACRWSCQCKTRS